MTKVEQLMAKGHGRQFIVMHMREHYGALAARSTDRYRAKVLERWRARRTMARPLDERIEERLERLKTLARKMERHQAWGALKGIELLISDIMGVRAPEQHDHRVAVGAVTPLTVTEIPKAEISPFTDAELLVIKAAAERMSLQTAPQRALEGVIVSDAPNA